MTPQFKTFYLMHKSGIPVRGVRRGASCKQPDFLEAIWAEEFRIISSVRYDSKMFPLIYVASFSVFHTEATVSIGLKTYSEWLQAQVRQSVSNLSFILSQHKQGRK